jgi:hypothetical protein
MKMIRTVLVMFGLVLVVGLTGGMSAKQLKVEETRQRGAKGRITLRVIDPEGRPVDKAEVTAGFYYPHKDQGIKKSITDTNGICGIEGMSCDDMWYAVSKNDYYETRGTYIFSTQENVDVEKGCWQPWNPIFEAVLKQIKNPVPMLSTGRLQPELPKTNAFIGFDLERKDWVAPYGKGVHDDFCFQIKRRFVSRDDYDAELTLVVTNSLDGIQVFLADTTKGSKFYLPYEAPMDGYKTNLVLRLSPGTQPQYLMDQNYIFRARTKTDENGRVVSALYGHIRGPIKFDVINSHTAIIVFSYYLNLDGTRNLEFKRED